MTTFNPGKLNSYLMLNLPSAWLCGVRVKEIDEESCTVEVKHSWINKNPFNSLYFAVQAMAAELSTGALVMQGVQNTPRKISMLVASNKSTFLKKATGKIKFTCYGGHLVPGMIDKAIETGEGQTFWMKSTAMNETGEQVAVFEFEWTIKVKNEIALDTMA